jgi:hypothetical protein
MVARRAGRSPQGQEVGVGIGIGIGIESGFGDQRLAPHRAVTNNFVREYHRTRPDRGAAETVRLHGYKIHGEAVGYAGQGPIPIPTPTPTPS